MTTISKSKIPKNPKEDIELLKSDVASFASSLGFSAALPNSGFDDTDFRKTGTLKPVSHLVEKHLKEKTKQLPKEEENQKYQKNMKKKKKKEDKIPLISIGSSKQFDALKNHPKLPLMKASSLGIWHVDAAELETKVIGNHGKKIEVKNADEWDKLVAKKELGERLLAQYTQDFDKSRGNSGDIKMLIATQRSGTGADQVSAFAVLVGENPVANIRSLDALLGKVTKKVGKRHALSGFEVLKELFLSSLLPDRKLKSMHQRPLNHLPESKDGYSLLLFWYWEECLKKRYEQFVCALEEASRDMLPTLKDKALKTIYVLLRSKSEQERKLLSALVNKLGDPINKDSSNAEFYLNRLLADHPQMTAVVIDEVDSFLFRPHLGLRAKYHAVNFLSQIRLYPKGNGPKVAKRLVDVYFALFKVLISDVEAAKKLHKETRYDKKGTSSHRHSKDESTLESNVETDSRFLSALLSGVNRAFPFVTSYEADDIIEVQTPMLFKLVHSKNFNVGVQALMLLDKIASKNQVVSDRFYRALYSKLLLPNAMNSSKAEMLSGLLHRAMKNDINLKRVSAFSKRLLQVALQQPPNFACGYLLLLSEVLKARPPLWNMVLQNESTDEDQEHFEDILEDPESQSRTVMSKLLGNIEEITCDSDKDVKNEMDFSSDSEAKNDFEEETDNDTDAEDDLFIRCRQNDIGKDVTVSDLGKEQPFASRALPGGYDPRHREPSYCNADRASWWELMVLASHVHPSVANMARTLLSGVNIVYNGNPLRDLSLPAFLDKFMEKKPKQATWHGGSQIEPAKKMDTNSYLIGAEILSLTEVDVPPEDFVFLKFYQNKMNSTKKSKKKKKKATEDEAAEEFIVEDGGNGSDEDGGNDSDEMIGGDESDVEVTGANGSDIEGVDGDYDYDDLDQVANEDDEDLIGNDSDDETDLPSEFSDEEDDNDDGPADVGDADDFTDDAVDDNNSSKKQKRSRKLKGRPGTSPFASLEEYGHLLNDDTPKTSSSRKKRRMSK